MKTRIFEMRALAVVAAAALALTASTALAQDSTAANTVQPVKLSTPQLSYGVSEVVKLEQAKASDDTIIAFVKNSGNSYGLDADQIIYLQQQGVSSGVITAMLNQPKPGTLPASAPAANYLPQPTSPAPVPVPDNSAYMSQPPPSTYAPSVASDAYPYDYGDSGYYAYPYYSSYYPYYGYYGYGYPAFGWGWGWGGYGWRGGYGHGGYGYHGGYGFHGGGGGFHGAVGGGFHGGGGGFHGGGGGGHR